MSTDYKYRQQPKGRRPFRRLSIYSLLIAAAILAANPNSEALMTNEDRSLQHAAAQERGSS
jgi:hypothetical protein